MVNEFKELNELELDNVHGGNINWKIFRAKFMEMIASGSIEITAEYKEIVEAIKNKDDIYVATKVIPLVATDPNIQKIIFECM